MKHYPSIRAFISYISQFKAAFWLTAATFAVANLALAIVPWLIGQLTISLTQHDGNMAVWTAALIVASISHDIAWRGGEFLYLKLLLARSHRFDDIVFNAVIEHEYGYFIDKFTGKISSYANSLGRDFRELLDNFHYQYVNLVVAMPIIAATMFTVNTYTGVIFVVSLLLMIIVGRKMAQAAAAAERKESDERSTMDGFMVDAISNFVTVKAFASGHREAARLYDKRHTLIRAANRSLFKNILFWGSMSLFVRWIIWPSTFILNVYLYSQGSIDLAQMTTFLAAIVLFSNNIWDIIWNISQLNIKLAHVEEAYRYLFGERDIFRNKPAITIKPLPASAFQHRLELRNLSFSYPDNDTVPVLSNVNLTISQGEKIGIVGPSGSGKSTLLKLLLGYYPVERSQLLLDDTPVDNRSLTDLTAYVPQDTAVFHRSIRENISYGRPEATEADIVTAAKHAQAHDFITTLSAGYDTLVGERGIKLSGGQRQRIAIARAILKDAPLLILDEATSALDSESEAFIQKALWQLMQDRTALVIAHRLSTVQKMDRIVVLENGRITEQGNHAELLKQNGTYAKLWAHQSGGFIEG